MYQRRLVDDVGRGFTKENPFSVQQIGKVESIYEDAPVAIPKSPMEFELKYFDSYPRPTSIGSDGFIYGTLGGAKTNTIFRTKDGFATIEEGYNFSVEAVPNSVIFVIKLGAKFIVVTQDKSTLKGAIWTSNSFTSGFTKVVDMVGGYPEILTISWYHGVFTTEQVMLVGEYGQQGTSKKLHATFNGGGTWSVIKQTTVTDATQNSHFHHSVYDPYKGRVWASQGDGNNAKISISDDRGVTWKDVPVPANTFGITKHQPTLMIPFAKGLFMAPDTDPIVPSVLLIPTDKQPTGLNGERFGLEWKHTVWDQELCGLHYGQPPFAQKNNEAYMLFPNFNGKKKSFVVATGDGGNTWHNVLVANGLASFQSGLIGPDSNGFIYAYIVDEWSNPRVLKGKLVQWLQK